MDADPPRTLAAAPRVHDRGVLHVGPVPDLVSDVPRAHRIEALPGPGDDPGRLLHDPAHAYGARGADRAAHPDHVVARAVGALRQAPGDRALDAAAVVVRVH